MLQLPAISHCTHTCIHTHTHTHTHLSAGLSPPLGGMGGPAEAEAGGPWKKTYGSLAATPNDGVSIRGCMSASLEPSLQTTTINNNIHTVYVTLAIIPHSRTLTAYQEL